MKGCRIGLDLGGTKVCGVVVDKYGRIVLGPVERPTESERDTEHILDTMVGIIRNLQELAGGEQLGTGIGIPVTLDSSGAVVFSPNLPTMAGILIRQEMEERLGVPVLIENDANCFVFGEWKAGAGSGTEVCCGITLGTGFGMGIIIHERLYRGAHGSAGEICFSPFRDGLKIEEVVSGIGISKNYSERTGRKLAAADVARKAREGDRDGREVWHELGDALGYALSYTVNLLDPEVVVIGGSMVAAWDLFFPSLEETLRQYVYKYDAFKLVPASLGRLGGAIGAGLLAEE